MANQLIGSDRRLTGAVPLRSPIRGGVDHGFWIPLTLMMMATITFGIVPEGFDWSVNLQNYQGSGGSGALGGSLARRLQWMPLILLAAYIIWVRRGIAFLLLPSINPFLLLFIAWCWVTMLWSPLPEVTLRKCVLLTGVFLIAFAYQVASWHPYRFLQILRRTLTALLIASVFMSVAMPQYGTHWDSEHLGSWRGITTNKNIMGQIATVGVIVWVHAILAHKASFFMSLPGLAAAVTMLVMCRSTTSLLATLLPIFTIYILARPPFRDRSWLSRILMLAGAVLILPWYFYASGAGYPSPQEMVQPIAGTFDKDVTLTGRTSLWAYTLEEWAEHPWAGLGYGAFWLGPNSPSGWIIDRIYWVPWQAHNGYIDILNETGIIGLSLVIGFFVVHIIHLRRLLEIDRVTFGFHVAVFIMFLTFNISETSLFRPINFLFLISMLSPVAVSRAISPVSSIFERLKGGGEDAPIWVREADKKDPYQSH